VDVGDIGDVAWEYQDKRLTMVEPSFGGSTTVTGFFATSPQRPRHPQCPPEVACQKRHQRSPYLKGVYMAMESGTDSDPPRGAMAALRAGIYRKEDHMVTKLVGSLLSVVCLSAAPLAHAQSCQIPNGQVWQNELGSQMNVNFDATGLMSGTYTTGVGCGAGTSRPLTGFCNGSAVTFTVNWQECSSVTAWSGTYNGNSLTTLWDLVNAGSPSWNSIVAGTDTFIVVSTTKK
jgi:hypothetical protein